MRVWSHVLLILALCALAAAAPACGGTSSPPPLPERAVASPTTPQAVDAGSVAKANTSAPTKKVDVALRPTKPLALREARLYMLALINRDRATEKLPPVELDDGGPPTRAAQAHAEDMASLGYLGHWGSDGSVPEQRHTEAGGSDMVLENALCFTDEAKRVVDAGALIDPKQIERAESLFFDEVPPNDGHRRNILRPFHTKVGIGIAQSTETAKELAVPCFAQELIGSYGTYTPLPKSAKVGAVIHVEGTLSGGAVPSGVGVARVALPKPIRPSELNKRRSYPVPKPFQMYWGSGFVTPILAKINGPKIEIDVPLSEKGQAGLYEVSVWAKLGPAQEQTMVSLRTIVVE